MQNSLKCLWWSTYLRHNIYKFYSDGYLSNSICRGLVQFRAPSLINNNNSQKRKTHTHTHTLKKVSYILRKHYVPKNFLYFGMKLNFIYYPNFLHSLKKFLMLSKKIYCSNLGQFPVPSLKFFKKFFKKDLFQEPFGMTADKAVK